MVKKRRRKDLKQPDEFVTVTMKLGQWVREHQRLVVFISAIIVVTVVGIALTIQLVGSSRVQNSDPLWEAISTASAPVIDPDDDENDNASKLPNSIQRFDSLSDRTEAATKAFEKVLAGGKNSGAGRAATLGLAASKFSKGEFAEARALYEDFANDPGGFDHLKAYAVEGTGLCFESQKNYDRALEQYRSLEKIDDGDHQDLAKYHQARMLEHLSKQREAADLYRGIVRRAEQATDDMITNLWVRDRAEARLAVIDPGSDVLKQRSKNRGSDLLKRIIGGRGGAGGEGLRLPRPPASGE